MQQNVNSLPATVKPALSAPFMSKIDGVLVSRFVYQLDSYFKIVALIDEIKMG